MEEFSQISSWTLAEDLRHPKAQENLHKTGLDRRKEKKKKLEGTINLDR